ncbi:MAG: ATP-dependent helicase [Deltaproteobacteria bacterium]|nr:ATP-dependent helicase [Deltaproteobacteria bacterium]
MDINLDQQQQVAVHTESARVLVLAAAGSGKTRTLIERIAYLVEEKNVSCYEITAFTFTRKAAGEIQSRLVERLGNKAYKIKMGTMHSLALEMIQNFGEVIGLKNKHVTVYGDFEEQFLLKDCALAMGVYNGKSWKPKKGDVDAVFNSYYQTGVEPDGLDPVHDLFKAFIARCKENNSMTYGGLLTGLKLLIPTMKEYVNIKHIFVDEIQDIDTLQWMIIREMEEVFSASLYVVGDLDQSIYAWRGAVPEYLLEHQNEFDIYRLQTNYRSRASIVNAANKLIANNIDRLPMEMIATREDDLLCPVEVYKNIDSQKLVEMRLCSDSITSPIYTKPVTVLSRNHALLEKLSMLLEEAHIEHVYIGKETALTNSEEFRRFHAHLKLSVNEFDNFSFLLIKDLMGISVADYSEIRRYAAETGQSHFQVWIAKEDIEYPASDRSLADVLKEMPTLCKWYFDINPIVDFIEKYIETSPKATVSQYLDWLATIDIQDEIKKEYEGLTLMTIHAAKGLERPTVIIAGCNEEIIPSKQAIRNDDIEGERRLMYVAMTRARDNLLLTIRPETTETNGREYVNPESRFIKEAIS